MKNFWTILLASALFAAIIMWSTPGFPAVGPSDSASPATIELGGLAALDTSLRGALRAHQQRLDSSCEFAAVRQSLLEVRDGALGAIGRLGGLWRAGRLRNGGMAVSEVLVYEFAELVDEAGRDTALADTLAVLQEETRESEDARELLQRMIDIHPAAPACLTRALEDQGGDRHATARAVERVIFTDYASARPW